MKLRKAARSEGSGVLRGAQKQVDPKIAAVVLVAVLAVVQWVWWRGLLAKPPPIQTQRQGGGPMGPLSPSVTGDEAFRVETLAGEPDPGDRDGPGYRARFDTPVGIALAPDGTLVVADSRNHRIRRITPGGLVTTVAGSVAGDADGAAGTATFRFPCGVAVAADGTIYVADTGNHRIRRIRDGVVSTLAGGARGMAAGVGAAARFDTPTGIAIGSRGDLIVADSGNRRVRSVTLAGKADAGAVSAGAPVGVAFGPRGLAVAGAGGLALRGGAARALPIAGAEGEAAKMILRSGLAVAPAADGWYVADAGHCGVFRTDADGGAATLLAGFSDLRGPASEWVDNTGNRARFGRIGGIVSDGKGRVYVCDTGNNAIRVLSPAEEGGALP